MSSRRRTSKKRLAPDSEEEDDEFLDEGANSGSGDDYFEPGTKSSRTKRVRTEVVEDDVDVEMDQEAGIDVEDTRFLPDGGASLSRSTSKRPSGTTVAVCSLLPRHDRHVWACPFLSIDRTTDTLLSSSLLV